MPSTLELCEKYFGTRDIYKLFEINKNSLEKDIKKAYYKLSLKVHPDRVSDEEKEEATEKFKILATLHQVLTDKNKKALYDEQGIVDDCNNEELGSWLELWKKIFKPISIQDIDNFKDDYTGSELEKSDIKKAYLNGKGCINYMMNTVPFMSIDDEPRIKEIVLKMIEANEVPDYEIFTNEPKSKKDRRHKKYEKEKIEVEKLSATNADLEKQIMEKRTQRENNVDSFFDSLLEKYGKTEKIKKIKKSKKQTNSVNKTNKKGVQSGHIKKRK